MPEPAPAAGAIAGVLLAAGMGRRFGGDKLLHALPDGQPMAQAAACTQVSGTCATVMHPGQTTLPGLLGEAGCSCPCVACRHGHMTYFSTTKELPCA